jgi:hypothetical protein
VCVTVSCQFEEKERGNHNVRLNSDNYNMHSSMFAYCYLLRLLDLTKNCIPAGKKICVCQVLVSELIKSHFE